MKRSFFVTLIAVFLLTLSSCIKSGDVRVLEVTDLSYSMSSVKFSVIVENNSAKKVGIESAGFTVKMKGRELLLLDLAEPVFVKRKTTTGVDLEFKMKLKNPFALLGLTDSDPDNLANQISILGDIRMKAGSFSRTIHIPETPMSEFITKFAGQDPSMLKSYF